MALNMRKALSGKFLNSGVQGIIHGPRITKGRPLWRAPLRAAEHTQLAFFFSEHLFIEASHMPPAFSQSAALVAFVTSPAKAGPVKASARAKANTETSVFMEVTPTRYE